MKAIVGAFNQDKALVGAFSVIVQIDGSFAALPCMQHFFSGNVEIPLNFSFATDLKKNPHLGQKFGVFCESAKYSSRLSDIFYAEGLERL